MLHPSLDELIDKVGSRYTLVVAAAKRARQLASNPNRFLVNPSEKPVTLALKEIYEGRVKIERPKSGIK
ncbi:MAG TPA: DNA-directed RNA polymerase subunit omega [Firmicutes bacterium]|nr:DNA-directed RNA polymerase subunit omega [Bacillota bacterium]